jgi:predicted protein tyrosine phosphatase
MKKFLCVCEGGNVRSRALAYILHDLRGQEAISIGWRWASEETMSMLCDWADVIVIMQPSMSEKIHQRFWSKLKCIDVGQDNYGINIHPSLYQLVEEGARNLLEEVRK